MNIYKTKVTKIIMKFDNYYKFSQTNVNTTFC